MTKKSIGWAVYGIVFLILAALPYMARLPSPEGAVQLTEARFTARDGKTSTVTLPHRWNEAQIEARHGVYDVYFELEERPQGPLYLFIPSFNDHLQVELDGVLTFDSSVHENRDGPTIRTMGLTLLTATHLKAGRNHLRLSLNGPPLVPGYLSALYLGGKDVVAPHYKLRKFLNKDLKRMAYSAQLLIGVGVFIAFLYRRREAVFGWVSVFAGLNALIGVHLFADVAPIVMGFQPYVIVVWSSMGVTIAILALSLAGRRIPRWLIAALFLVPAAALVLIQLGLATSLTIAIYYSTPIMILGFLAALTIISKEAFYKKKDEAKLILGPVALIGWYVIHDLLVVKGHLPGLDFFAQEGRPFFVAMITIIFMRRLSISLNELDRNEVILQARLAAQKEQLSKQTVELQDANASLKDINQELAFQKRALDEHAIVSITDVKGVITYANDKFCELSGYSREELLGQNHRIVKSNEHPESLFTEMWRTIANGKPWHGELKNRKKNGESYWVNATIVPFLDENAKPYQYVSIRTDLSDLKKTQEELRQASSHKAISQLAEGISHELNTPIQYVGSSLEFVNKSVEDIRTAFSGHQVAVGEDQDELDYLFEETPNAVTQALEGLEKMRLIVQAMKDFSHHPTTKKGRVDINHALSTVMTISHSQWAKIAEIETDLDPDLPMVMALAADLNQVFLDLLLNASEAIAGKDPRQKGKIRIKTSREGQWVEVRISDTGGGIPAGVADQIFNPFFTTKAPGAGIGQGLTVSYESIVKKHEGMITFESEEGRGATFIVRLPL